MLETSGGGLPNLVPGFSSCLGVPRYASNESAFVTLALAGIGVRYDRLLDLVKDVADEDPFAALRLLQVCGVHRLGHIIIVVPPPLVYDFATARGDAIASLSTFASNQQEPFPPDSTHSLHVGAVGASLASLARHASVSYRSSGWQAPCRNGSWLCETEPTVMWLKCV
jgi:hypothetical protein